MQPESTTGSVSLPETGRETQASRLHFSTKYLVIRPYSLLRRDLLLKHREWFRRTIRRRRDDCIIQCSFLNVSPDLVIRNDPAQSNRRPGAEHPCPSRTLSFLRQRAHTVFGRTQKHETSLYRLDYMSSVSLTGATGEMAPGLFLSYAMSSTDMVDDGSQQYLPFFTGDITRSNVPKYSGSRENLTISAIQLTIESNKTNSGWRRVTQIDGSNFDWQ